MFKWCHFYLFTKINVLDLIFISQWLETIKIYILKSFRYSFFFIFIHLGDCFTSSVSIGEPGKCRIYRPASDQLMTLYRKYHSLAIKLHFIVHLLLPKCFIWHYLHLQISPGSRKMDKMQIFNIFIIVWIFEMVNFYTTHQFTWINTLILVVIVALFFICCWIKVLAK